MHTADIRQGDNEHLARIQETDREQVDRKQIPDKLTTDERQSDSIQIFTRVQTLRLTTDIG